MQNSCWPKQLRETSRRCLNQQMAICKTKSEQRPEAYKAGFYTMAKLSPCQTQALSLPCLNSGMSWELSLVPLAQVSEDLVHDPTCFAVGKFNYCFYSSPRRELKYAFIRDVSRSFFLFPHMELRLMFHTLWTNSSCHGYHSLEFPISWVIKFPALILLYWFIYVTPYILGLLSLGEQSRTFHRVYLLRLLHFALQFWGKRRLFFSQGVPSSPKYTGMTPRTPEPLSQLLQ